MASYRNSDGLLCEILGMFIFVGFKGPDGGVTEGSQRGHRKYAPAFKTYCRAPLAGKLMAAELG